MVTDKYATLVFGLGVLAQQRLQVPPPRRSEILPNLVGVLGLRDQGGMVVKLGLDNGLPGWPSAPKQPDHPRSSDLPHISGHRPHQGRTTSLGHRFPLPQQVPLLGCDTANFTGRYAHLPIVYTSLTGGGAGLSWGHRQSARDEGIGTDLIGPILHRGPRFVDGVVGPAQGLNPDVIVVSPTPPERLTADAGVIFSKIT